MKLIMCFDDEEFADSIENVIKKWYPRHISETKQSKIEELIKSIYRQEFDYNIIFLDMHYNTVRQDGVRIGEMINKMLPDCAIMYFVDNYDEIPKVYDVEHYCLCKKKDAEIWLKHFMDRLIKDNRENLQNQYLELIFRRRHIFICQTDIIYIERKNRMIEIHTSEKVYAIYSSIKKIYNQLNSLFERCHGSFIVNMGCIKCVDGDEIILKSGIKIPLGETYKKKFDYRYQMFIGNKF